MKTELFMDIVKQNFSVILCLYHDLSPFVLLLIAANVDRSNTAIDFVVEVNISDKIHFSICYFE